MKGQERHYFPGNNTPRGFYSYYRYILGQQDAERIFCLKGGPGTGKSTFMRRLGEEFLEEGRCVDFLHCSSDPHSLDGVLLRKERVAVVDATAPHIIDPLHPGAVDEIVHLGDFWNEEGIRQNRKEIMACQKEISGLYENAYGYLSAAEKLYNNLEGLRGKCVNKAELYKLAAGLINRELSHRELGPHRGKVRKLFASAITPEGVVHFLPTLSAGFRRSYLLRLPKGMDGSEILGLFMESALCRGFDMEVFYCAIKPEEKPEHLLIPDLGVAFFSSNQAHPIDPSALSGQVSLLELDALLEPALSPFRRELAEDNASQMDALLDRAVGCLKEAKAQHDHLETFYVPNMDFSGIEKRRRTVSEKIRQGFEPQNS
ncbi:MAG: ATPase [Bacillota bacterium]|nr:ATPase [Bacillota bacterium]